jgi:hypothetical protein
LAKRDFSGVGEGILNREREGEVAVYKKPNLAESITKETTREEIETDLLERFSNQRKSGLEMAVEMEFIRYEQLWSVTTTLDGDGKRVSERSKYQNESDYWSEFAEKFDVSMAFVRQYLEAGQILRENKGFFKSIDFMKTGNIAKVLAFKKIKPMLEAGKVDEKTVKNLLVKGKVKDIEAIADAAAQPRLETIRAETNVHVEGDILKLDDRPFLSFAEDAAPDVKKLVADTVKEEARRRAAKLEIIPVEVTAVEKPEFERDIGKLRTIRDKGHRAYIFEVPADLDDPGLFYALSKALDPFVARVVKEYWSNR